MATRPGKATLCFNLPRSIHKRLKRMAKRHGRTVTQQLTQAILWWELNPPVYADLLLDEGMIPRAEPEESQAS